MLDKKKKKTNCNIYYKSQKIITENLHHLQKWIQNSIIDVIARFVENKNKIFLNQNIKFCGNMYILKMP